MRQAIGDVAPFDIMSRILQTNTNTRERSPTPVCSHNYSVAPRKPIDATAFSTTDARCCRAACLLDLRQVRQRRQCGRKPAQHRHESALGHQVAGVQSDCRLDGPPAHPGSLEPADGVVWLIRPSSPASAGRERSNSTCVCCERSLLSGSWTGNFR